MTIRFELKEKFKPPVSDSEYRHFREILKEARKKSEKHHIFWDCEKGEKKSEVRKKILYVAEKENLPLKVQSQRGKSSLRLNFSTNDTKGMARRIPPEEARAQILKALERAKSPLSRHEILLKTDVSAASWNLRVLELLGKKKIRKVGSGRGTRYVLNQQQLKIPERNHPKD